MSVAQQEERIAVLLSSLGEEVAGQVISELPDETATRVQNLLDEFRDDPLDDEEIEDVLDEFLRFFRFAVGNDQDIRTPKAEEPHGDSAANATPAPQEEPDVETPFVPTGDPFRDLEQLKPFQLAGGLRSENARTIAVVLNCVSAESAGHTLQHLPEQIRSEVFLALRDPPKMPTPLLESVVATTVQKGAVLQLRDVADPVTETNKKLAELLRAMEQKQRGQMLSVLGEQDAEAVQELKKLLYSFDDLKNITNRSVQKVLGEVASSSLALALKDAEPEVMDRIMGNLSKRARATLEEEIEFLGDVKSDEQEQARASVCEVMARLDESGDLEMNN